MKTQSSHIGLNAHLLSLRQSYRGAGISWYIYNLLKNLPQAAPDNQYSVFLRDRAMTETTLNLNFSRLPTQQPFIRIFWEQFVQPLALRQTGVDLLHAMAFVAPAVVPCPFVVTVYDLSFLRFPEAFRPFNRFYLRYFTGHSVKRAKAVITISESTRQDVITLLHVPAERVHTIYCGVDDSFQPRPGPEVAAFKAKHNLPESFVLFLGTLEPRKNVEGLITAYAHWRQRDKSAPPLVVAGGKGWHYAQIFRQVEALGLQAAVHFPGYVPQEELPLWYNAADLFVYPSFFEGFGLPVLEAMACGTPVITSNVSSLPEVAGTGGAVQLIDPTDTESLAGAMAGLMRQPEQRLDMARRGQLRAAQFDWQKTARATASIYQKVLAL